MNVDDELRAAGARLRAHTAVSPTDVDSVVSRSRARQRRSTITAAVAAFVVLLAAVAGVGIQRRSPDAGVSVYGDGSSSPQAPSEPNSSTTTTTTTPRPVAQTGQIVTDAIGGGAPCDTATFSSIVAKQRHQTVTRVDRYACINNWASARVATAESGTSTYAFHIENREWTTVSSDLGADAGALAAFGAPIDTLYRIMGLSRSPVATTTTRASVPLTVVTVDEASRPPAALLARVTTAFLRDIGDDAVRSTIGTSIQVFDGYVLSATTMRALDDADRAAIREALEAAGFTVQFIPFVDASAPELPTLVLADPAIHREGLVIVPGSFAVYAEIGGCGQLCGYGADYLGRPDGDQGWIVTPGVDPTVDPPVTPTPTEPVPTTEAPPESTTTTTTTPPPTDPEVPGAQPPYVPSPTTEPPPA